MFFPSLRITRAGKSQITCNDEAKFGEICGLEIRLSLFKVSSYWFQMPQKKCASETKPLSD